MNARELIHIICSMIYGRGKYYEEIIELGLELKAQFDERYPGLVEANAKYYTDDLSNALVIKHEPCKKPEYVSHSVDLLAGSTNSANVINELAKASGYDKFDFKTSLKDDKLSKLLEHFSYTFKINNFALIILKHYSRHRMQSLSTAPIVQMAGVNKFVIPETIEANAELKAEFEKCIKENRRIYNKLLEQNLNPYLMIYITPHAAAIDFVSTMNARELLHFANLRTCTRAQREIRYLATDMLKLLKKQDSELFENYGPSCYTYGVCPEGRLCCGKQMEMKEKFDNLEK
jgi:thymidylate synthase (FAD)